MINIVKKLFIQNKEQFYKIIEPNDELSSNTLFIPFMDSMRDYYYGCKCNESYFNDFSDKEYNNLKNEEVTNLLKEHFGCDIVQFV